MEKPRGKYWQEYEKIFEDEGTVEGEWSGTQELFLQPVFRHRNITRRGGKLPSETRVRGAQRYLDNWKWPERHCIKIIKRYLLYQFHLV